MLTVCYAAKGGSGTSVTAAALALTTPGSLLVDLDGDALDVLGLPCGTRPGIVDWLSPRPPSPTPSTTSSSRRASRAGCCPAAGGSTRRGGGRR